MAPTSSSCQLYEGNFEDWRKRMNAIFMVLRRPRQLSPASLYDPTIGGTLDAASTPSEVQTVRRRISPALLARLPEDLWSPERSLGALYKQLQQFCQPFRLFSLPAELRIKIYEEVINQPEIISPNEKPTWTVTSSHRLPALAQTTQQLRQELLPIYFSAVTFTLTIDIDVIDGRLSYPCTVKDLALGWSCDFIGASARHLRHISLDLTVLETEPGPLIRLHRITLNLFFSKTKGYWVEYPDNLSSRSKEALGEHVRFVNTKRKYLGLNGEALLVALVEEYCMWDFVGLSVGEDLY
ncbi:hypothetical protein M409DRAFT_56628 [Zasmidium cellare ATCC 36951]|uniref:F-box domain-containing protein n=1 Tax=Zasmidium cellare ATCC 36951 TaxID=1080233 RepID=A0A6A6CEJ9_ZASCE|nr:uncharacterized protein M409DRAFT_56628 [Zasmidium cellare ATCC 36951]KAF2164352.1 hypothetical protein M409DRAFT_56628 [Zasmidium cellare ATCC 36951]